MNRFTWDMRYPGARDFPGLIMWAGSTRGPQAPTGRYQVKLTAAGATRTQDFTIKRNAAIPGVTDADLQEQFKLAKAISDKVTTANEAVLRIRHLKSQLAERTDKNPDAGLKTAAQALSDKLTAVEGEIYQYRNRSSQDPLNYPIRLNNKLAALQGIVESGDSKPTDQSYAVFKDLSARLDQQLARLEAIAKSDVDRDQHSADRVEAGAARGPCAAASAAAVGGQLRSTVISTIPSGSSSTRKRSSGFSTPALKRSAGRYGRSCIDSVMSRISGKEASATSAIAASVCRTEWRACAAKVSTITCRTPWRYGPKVTSGLL